MAEDQRARRAEGIDQSRQSIPTGDTLLRPRSRQFDLDAMRHVLRPSAGGRHCASDLP